jgi:hypothetical protein
MLKVTPKELSAFWARTRQTPNGCLEWTGSKLRGGYGGLTFHRKSWQAHRWIMAVLHGESDLLVLHSCPGKDNPSCVNPAHLRYGTRRENAMDALERGQLVPKQKTHCKYGHELTDENRYRRPGGGSECYTCRNKRNAYWNGKRAEARRAKESDEASD